MPFLVSVKLATGAQAMDVEEYVKGVVPYEMSTGWPAEALKAQALAAKSYAIAEGSVEVTDRSQVYGPNRFADTTAAVEAVRGIYLAYERKIVTPFFFGHCSGRTRTPSQAGWAASSDRTFLQPVACECGFKGYFGHGIGMCQEGAKAMANRGATYDQILRHYYTGIEFVDENLQPVTSLAAVQEPMLTYVVQAGDTLLTIAAKFGVEWGAIFQANSTLIKDPNTLEAGLSLRVPASVAPQTSVGDTYEVVSGDTLSKLAQRWGCTVAAIVALNGIADPDRIEVGQRLKRP